MPGTIFFCPNQDVFRHFQAKIGDGNLPKKEMKLPPKAAQAKNMCPWADFHKVIRLKNVNLNSSRTEKIGNRKNSSQEQTQELKKYQ